MILEKIKNGLIVSCQALENEPLHSSFIMSKMAKAAEEGGASGIRANGVEDIIAIRKETNLPIIGIIKQDYEDSDVYITPTIKEVNALLRTDCEIIALDGTNRPRPLGTSLRELVDRIHDAGRLAMADVSILEEAIAAEKIGFDLVSTTMAGYTNYSGKLDEPAFGLIKRIKENIHLPVIMEGHTRSPEHVKKGLQSGAFAVVVGSIITRPQYITKIYTDIIKEIK